METMQQTHLIQLLESFTVIMNAVVIIAYVVIYFRVGVHTQKCFFYSVGLFLVSGAAIHLFTSAPFYVSVLMQAMGVFIALFHYVTKRLRGV